MSKYAPAREDGLKPYVVTLQDWGRSREVKVYAKSAPNATYLVIGRPRPGVYHVRTRRATPDDMATHHEGTTDA